MDPDKAASGPPESFGFSTAGTKQQPWQRSQSQTLSLPSRENLHRFSTCIHANSPTNEASNRNTLAITFM